MWHPLAAPATNPRKFSLGKFSTNLRKVFPAKISHYTVLIVTVPTDLARENFFVVYLFLNPFHQLCDVLCVCVCMRACVHFGGWERGRERGRREKGEGVGNTRILVSII